MTEQKVIASTKRMNTVASLSQDLLKLGVQNDQIILVHTSLSNIGWVCGGAQTVIMALLQAVGENGTLVMPAHSGDFSNPAEWENPPVPKEWIAQIYENMPAFDVNFSPTRSMGRIAELFRTLPQVLRSNHPQVSFAARGKYAKQITENHELTPQLGLNSLLGKMYELNAKVLLLGTDYHSCTSFHLAETFITEMPKKRMGTAVTENGQRIWKWFEDFAYDSETDFEQLGKSFDETGNVIIGNIGNAQSRLFCLKTAVDFAQEWLTKNRFKS
jgi:aminoglycoside 3-N-acetyltransferase